MTTDLQENACLDYCSSAGIKVSHTVKLNCGSEESLEILLFLLRTLPKEVDTLIAARFFDYSYLLPQLGRLCLMFQCRETWVYTLEHKLPLYKYLPCLRAEDFALADERYRNAMNI